MAVIRTELVKKDFFARICFIYQPDYPGMVASTITHIIDNFDISTKCRNHLIKKLNQGGEPIAKIRSVRKIGRSLVAMHKSGKTSWMYDCHSNLTVTTGRKLYNVKRIELADLLKMKSKTVYTKRKLTF